MQKLLFTPSILLLSCFISIAQNKVTLSGYIRDESTGEELIGATIQVQGTSTGTVTNAYGFYSLTLPAGTYRFVASYLGYNPYFFELNIAANQTLNFQLKQEASELDEVIVKGEAANSNVTVNQMSVARLEPKLVKELPAVLGEPDIIRSLQLLPGVTTVADGAAGFNVRGGSVDQNLILLDEGTLYNSSHLFGLFSVANPDAVKSVELFKGGIPARYGGRVSSVLDIRQREGNMKEFNGEAGIGLISARALVEGPIVQDKSSYMVAARRSYGDLFLPLIDNTSTAFFYDLNMKTNLIVNDRNRLFLSGYFGRDRFSLGSIFNSAWGNATATLRWNHLFSEKLFANFSAIYSNYDYSLDQLRTGAQFNWKSRIITQNAKVDFTYFAGQKAQLEFGADVKRYEFQPGTITPIQGSAVAERTLDKKFATEAGAYVSYEQTFGKLTFNAGLRYSLFLRQGQERVPVYENGQPVVYSSAGLYENGRVLRFNDYQAGERISTFHNFEPRFATTFVINNASSIKASYNRLYQYLHLISNTTAPTPTDIWTPSGPFIKPQEADQYALGYFRNFKNNAYEASVEVFYKNMNNLVDYVDGADLVTNNNIETELLRGRGRSYGAEFFVRKNTGRLTGWISYTLSRAERQIKGLTAEDPGINNGRYYAANFDKPHNLAIVASYKLSERWSLSSNFALATGIPATFPTGKYEFAGMIVPHFAERNTNRLPAYHRLDISATLKGKKKRWKNGGHEWVFGVYNVYNRANATSIYFNDNPEKPGNVRALQSYLLGILPSVTYNFKF